MSKKVSKARAEISRRELSKRRLRHFVKYVFPEYKQRPHNLLIADAVDLVINRIINRLMIFVAPQMGKSELVSRKTPALLLGRNPDEQIILASYTASLATSLSRDARDLIKTRLYQNLFGVYASTGDPIELADGSKSATAWSIQGHKGRLLAAGVGGGISGHTATFGIIDDPVKDDLEAQSELVKDRHWDWYWGAFHTRLSPDAGVILCMTRWAEDDLAGRLLTTQDEYGEYWHVLRMPALAERPTQTEEWCRRHKITPERHLTVRRVTELLINVQ